MNGLNPGKVVKKSWEVFLIFQLFSTANPAQLQQYLELGNQVSPENVA